MTGPEQGPEQSASRPYAEVFLTRAQVSMVTDAMTLNPKAEFVLLQHPDGPEDDASCLRAVWITPAGAESVLVSPGGSWIDARA